MHDAMEEIEVEMTLIGAIAIEDKLQVSPPLIYVSMWKKSFQLFSKYAIVKSKDNFD